MNAKGPVGTGPDADEALTTNDTRRGKRKPNDAFNAIRWVMEHSSAKLADRLVLMVLAWHADRQGRNSHPNQATIAREAGGISVRQVQRSIRDLRELGELDWERRVIQTKAGPRYLNVYWLPPMQPDNLSHTQADNLAGNNEKGPDNLSEEPDNLSVEGDISFGRTSKEPPRNPPKNIALASPTQVEVEVGEIVEPDDGLMDALEKVFGNAPRDKRLRGAWNVARRQLAEQGATADQIRELVPMVRKIPKLNTMAMTPTALAKHWGQIGSGKFWELVDWKDQAFLAYGGGQ